MLSIRHVAPALLLTAGIACGGAVAEETGIDQTHSNPFIPLFEPEHYIVKYMGITCGHMTLESRLDELNGRPAYHITMTARNSKFFNKIYKVDARIDSWIDAESETTAAYESIVEEKGEAKTRKYEVDSAAGTVTAHEDGDIRTLTFEPSTPVLDPLAYIFRLQALAPKGDDSFSLTLLTTDGALQTDAVAGEIENHRTSRGRRNLLVVRPRPSDGEMFSRKGEVSLWIDPEDNGRLYTIDFKLSFGHLKAYLDSPEPE